MTEYIERGTAIAKLTALEVTTPSATMTDAKRLLADMPAADVAPVVHCRHCRSYNKPRLGWCSVHLDCQMRCRWFGAKTACFGNLARTNAKAGSGARCWIEICRRTLSAISACERMTTMPKRVNPRRRPATMADVQRAKDAATADACRVTLAIFFTALLDKEGMDAEQLQRIWHEVEALSESVRDGYVSAPDLIRVLREEYEIDIIGG